MSLGIEVSAAHAFGSQILKTQILHCLWLDFAGRSARATFKETLRARRVSPPALASLLTIPSTLRAAWWIRARWLRQTSLPWDCRALRGRRHPGRRRLPHAQALR